MEIVEIFPPYLYSIKYEEKELDEYHQAFHDWNDVDVLMDFFTKYISFLNKRIWKNINNEPEKAARTVIEDANILEVFIKKLAENTKAHIQPDFDKYFHSLGGKYIYEWKLVPMKAYGKKKHTFLRLYAIKLGSNCYLVVYGGLKLADTIQNSPILNEEVFKHIDKTLDYLKQTGIAEGDDL